MVGYYTGGKWEGKRRCFPFSPKDCSPWKQRFWMLKLAAGVDGRVGKKSRNPVKRDCCSGFFFPRDAGEFRDTLVLIFVFFCGSCVTNLGEKVHSTLASDRLMCLAGCVPSVTWQCAWKGIFIGSKFNDGEFSSNLFSFSLNKDINLKLWVVFTDGKR